MDEARAEVERLYAPECCDGWGCPDGRFARTGVRDFLEGVEWADAHPAPRTITRAHADRIREKVRSATYHDGWDVVAEVLRGVGIKIEEED